MVGYKLYLDDERIPKTKGWTIVRSVEEFIQVIQDKGVPEHISFDHDLGELEAGVLAPNGLDAAKWLIENEIVPKSFNVHSANPIGAKNIESLLNNWIHFKQGIKLL